jgi:hypothetical protein
MGAVHSLKPPLILVYPIIGIPSNRNSIKFANTVYLIIYIYTLNTMS